MYTLDTAKIFSKYIILLQPTSPVRLPHTLDNAIKFILKEKSDSLLSVTRNHSFVWKKEKLKSKWHSLSIPSGRTKHVI